MDFMNDKRQDGVPQVWLGDLNVSPSIPAFGIDGEYESNYNSIVADGWVEANTFSDTPFCTHCPEENVTGLFEGTYNSAIDHIWVRNANVSNPERLLDDTYRARGRTYHPSDHFALGALVSPN